MQKRSGTIATILAVLLLLLVGFVIVREHGDGPNPSGQTIVTHVDRGMSDKDRALFEERIANLEKEIADKNAAGERDISLLLRLGNLYYGIGELGKAVDKYRDILSTNPADAPALENLGQTYLEMGDYQAAYTTWQKAIDASPYEVTYIRLVDLVVEHLPEKDADVRLILEHAIANIGQTSDLMRELGDWYARSGDLARAVSHYEVAVQLNPTSQGLKDQLEVYRQQLWEQQGQ